MGISLKNKILLGFVINILVVLTLGLVSYEGNKTEIEIEALEKKHNDIVLSVNRIFSRLITSDNLAKSYVLAGDQKYLDQLDENRHAIIHELNLLNSLLEENTEQRNRMDHLQKILAKSILIRDQFIALRNQNRISEVGDYLQEKSTLKVLSDSDGILLKIQEAENIAFEKIIEREEKTENLLDALLNVLLFFTVILLVVVYFIITYQLKTRKAAEQLVKGNDQLVRSIIDNSNTPIFLKKINGQYLLVNKQFQKIFNKSNLEIIGRTDHDIYPKEIADSLRSGDIEVISTETEKTFEEKFTHDNITRNYVVVKFPLWDENNRVYAVGGIATDITEKSKLDLQVKESEVQFQTILDSAPDAIVVIDDEGKIIRWNPKAESLFGWKSNEVMGKLMSETIMPQRYKEDYQKGFKNYINSGKETLLNKTVETAALNKTNMEFQVELSISPAKLNGKYIFISFIRDITERKQLQKKIEESEKFLNTIIENIPDIIFVKDPKELRYLRLNIAAENWIGIPRKDLLNKNNYDLFPKEQADFFTKTDMDILNTGDLIDIPEEEANTRNGKRWLHTKKIPIKNESGQPLYLLGISEDITEKKQLQLEKIESDKMLRESAQRVALILENIGEGVIVVDQEQRVILSNHKAEEVIGLKEDDFLSSPLDLAKKYQLFYPDEKTIFPAQDLPLTKALKGEQTSNIEIVIQDIVTRVNRHVIIYGAPIKDENNVIIAAVTTIKDITNLKELAVELNLSEGSYRNLIGFKRQEKKDVTA